MESVSIDDNVSIYHYSWILGSGEQRKISLSIREGAVIGHYAHIVAMHSVVVGKDAFIADKVFISDCSHRFKDTMHPIIKQGIELLNPVTIGDGAWIGENVSIFGASVGEHSIIGANSVVTTDIPSFSVAVGTPAKVVKYYDFDIKKWRHV